MSANDLITSLFVGAVVGHIVAVLIMQIIEWLGW